MGPTITTQSEDKMKDVESTIQTAAAFVFLLLLDLLLNLCQAVSVHLQLDIKDLALVLPPLDCSSDGEEAGRVFDQKALFICALQGTLQVHRHVHTGAANALVADMIGAQNLNCFVIRIDPSKNVSEQIFRIWKVTSSAASAGVEPSPSRGDRAVVDSGCFHHLHAVDAPRFAPPGL